MIYRQRNILNWVAFVSLVLFILIVALVFFNTGADAIPALGKLLTFRWGYPRVEFFIALAFYLYLLWVLIQYVIWKKPVFIPWRFKDEEE
jgi:hypothetical protein|tara:strand:+ start:21 stop:290 length:270 start_codon:yes stop_codon:yes gene_type:complete